MSIFNSDRNESWRTVTDRPQQCRVAMLRSSLAKDNALRGTDEVNVESIRTPINMSIPSLVCRDTGAHHAFILRGKKGIIKKYDSRLTSRRDHLIVEIQLTIQIDPKSYLLFSKDDR